MSDGNTALRVSPVDLITALQEGENAKARVPQLESENAELRRQLNESQRHSQELELKCTNYREQIENLSSKVRSLVVERDDAGFRELEATDRLDRLRAAVRDSLGSLAKAVEASEPPAKQVKEPEPAPSPTASPAEPAPTFTPAPSQATASEGHSDPSPTPDAQSSPAGSQSAQSGNVSGTEDASGRKSYEAPPWWEDNR